MKDISHSGHYNIPEITVSLTGVNKFKWVYAGHDETKKQAFDKMQKNRFDVLPIQETDGSYKRYYKTKNWGEFEISNIKIDEIKSKDCFSHQLHIRDAIKIFANQKRNFFFLKNEKEVDGLLTAGNLNSKYVYVYLYNLISLLEFKLGNLINESGIDDLQLYRIFEENNKSVKPNTRYRREIKKGLDHKFIEFAYLGDMAWIIKEKKLYSKIRITGKDFDFSVKLINKLRNIVAHPVNSLIKGKGSIVELNLAITKIELLQRNINSYLK